MWHIHTIESRSKVGVSARRKSALAKNLKRAYLSIPRYCHLQCITKWLAEAARSEPRMAAQVPQSFRNRPSRSTKLMDLYQA
jgi:hypothetical protein